MEAEAAHVTDDGQAHETDVTVGSVTYPDGSTFNGTLYGGTPHGLGRCTWADGSWYDGEWRSGMMHGFGTFTWNSGGQRYDGEWKDGKRDGVGVKVYADGSTFDGFWRDGCKNGVGVFWPAPEASSKKGSGSAAHVDDADPPAGSVASDGADGADGSHTPRSPREAAPSMAAASVALLGTSGTGRGRSEDVDGASESHGAGGGKKEVFIRKFQDGVLLRESVMRKDELKLIFGDLPGPKGADAKVQRSKTIRQAVRGALGVGKSPKLVKRQGQQLYKGVPGYDLMVQLQVGIRYSVWANAQREAAAGEEAQGPPTGRPLPASAFAEKTKVFLPSAGSETTLAHPSGDFYWKEYAGTAFRNLRQSWGIQDAQYVLSLAGSSALWQLNSPGKSGCLFFLSDDQTFLIKTTKRSEIKALIDMLPAYYRHMQASPDSLVTRFYGVHSITSGGSAGRTVRFLVMSNIFKTDVQIHRRYDLKGSSAGRTVGPLADPSDLKTVLKDLDMDLSIHLPKATHTALVTQLESDSDFLKTMGVMDYSLLLGVHFPRRLAAPAAHVGGRFGDSDVVAGGPTHTASAPTLGPNIPHSVAGAKGSGPAGIARSGGSVPRFISKFRRAAAAAAGAAPAVGAAPAAGPADSSAAAAAAAAAAVPAGPPAAASAPASFAAAPAAAPDAAAATVSQPSAPHDSDADPCSPFAATAAFPAGADGFARSASVGTRQLPPIPCASPPGGVAPPHPGDPPMPMQPQASTIEPGSGSGARAAAVAAAVEAAVEAAAAGLAQAARRESFDDANGGIGEDRMSRAPPPPPGMSVFGAVRGGNGGPGARGAPMDVETSLHRRTVSMQLEDVLLATYSVTKDDTATISVAAVSPSAAAPPSAAAQQQAQQETQHAQQAQQHPQHADRVRNFDVFSSRVAVDEWLAAIEARMQGLSYSDERIQDVLGLAKLKILGDKVKSGWRKKGKRTGQQANPAAVLKAMQVWRQELMDLGPGEGACAAHAVAHPDGGSGDEAPARTSAPSGSAANGAALHGSDPGGVLGAGGGPDGGFGAQPHGVGGVPGHEGAAGGGGSVGARVGQQLGISMTGVAMHRKSRYWEDIETRAAKSGRPFPRPLEQPATGAEEVVVFMGVIDILQCYNARKTLERSLKSVTNERLSISVAPPKVYSSRFFEHMRDHVFKPVESAHHLEILANSHSAAAQSAGRRGMSAGLRPHGFAGQRVGSLMEDSEGEAMEAAASAKEAGHGASPPR